MWYSPAPIHRPTWPSSARPVTSPQLVTPRHPSGRSRRGAATRRDLLIADVGRWAGRGTGSEHAGFSCAVKPAPVTGRRSVDLLPVACSLTAVDAAHGPPRWLFPPALQPPGSLRATVRPRRATPPRGNTQGAAIGPVAGRARVLVDGCPGIAWLVSIFFTQPPGGLAGRCLPARGLPGGRHGGLRRGRPRSHLGIDRWRTHVATSAQWCRGSPVRRLLPLAAGRLGGRGRDRTVYPAPPRRGAAHPRCRGNLGGAATRRHLTRSAR